MASAHNRLTDGTSTAAPYHPLTDGHSGPSHELRYDLVLVSSDTTYFNIHTAILLANSNNHFNDLLPPTLFTGQVYTGENVLSLSESSMVVAVMLHTIYGADCERLSPPFEDLVRAVDALKKYGMHVHSFLNVGTRLFALLHAHTPSNALAVYVLASKHDIYDLAAYASSHLLSSDIRSLPADMVDQIKPIYFLRLARLHMDRVETFKRLLLPYPTPHPPTTFCSPRELNDTWESVRVFLSFAAKPDLSSEVIKATFNGVESKINCGLCREALNTRLQTVVEDWAAVTTRI